MQIVQATRIWKLIVCAVGLMAVFMFASCASLNTPVIQQLLADLQSRGVRFTPHTPFYGTVSGLFPPTLYPLSFVVYERRSARGELLGVLLLDVTQTLTQTQQVVSNLQTYAADPYGLGGLDLAGPLRYYRCNNVVVVYQGMWQTGIDPMVDEVLAEDCGPAFIRYPLPN